MSVSSNLEHCVVLVTGGGSGIGAGIARVMASEGAHVVIGDIDLESAQTTSALLISAGARASAVSLDVTSRRSLAAADEEIRESVGPVNVLVNNAGISTVRSFLDIDETAWDSMMAVNVKGVLLATQQFLPAMINQRWGRIVNISSMAGKQGLPRLAHYCATKFAVIGMTQSLAFEVAPHNITVNAVCPGVVRTPLWDDDESGILNDLDGERGWDSFVSGIPLGRPQTPEDMGRACLYFIAPSGDNVTGEALNVAGGQQVH